MAKELSTFSYSVLESTDLSKKLQLLCGYIRKAKKQGNVAALDIGTHLSTAMAEMVDARKPKHFGDWAEKECGLAPRTSYRYMRLAKHFSSKQDGIEFLSLRAMEVLSEDNAPAAAKADAIKKAKAGTSISEKTAKGLVEHYTVNGIAETKTNPAKKSIAAPVLAVIEEAEVAATQTDLEALSQYDHASQKQLVEEVAHGDATNLAEAIEADALEHMSPAERAEHDMKKFNSALNSWALAMRKQLKELPECGWLDEAQRDAVASQLTGTIHTAKICLGSAVCPHCEGKGCNRCKQVGWMPKLELDKWAK